MHSKRYKSLLLLLFLLLIGTIILASCLGALKISFTDFLNIIGYKLGFIDPVEALYQKEKVLFNIRFPRVLLSVLIGGTLAVSGAVLQSLFRNPLAEASLLGVTSGGAMFASVFIVLGSAFFPVFAKTLGTYGIIIFAFLGALLSVIMVYKIAMYKGRAQIATLLLAGIAINALASSFTGFMSYLSSDDKLRNITFWMLGSLGGASWKVVFAILPFVAIPLIGFQFLSKGLNAFSLGETQAAHLGISVQRLKNFILVGVALGVGASVSVSGAIGFVGLVVPHILRMSFGSDNKFIIPASALLGASLLALADLAARTIISPTELPIGILTSFVGTPIFLYIIFKEKSRIKA